MTKTEAGKLGYLKSREGQAAARKQRLEAARNEYHKSPKLCAGCRTPLPFEKRLVKFCTRSCAAVFNNRHHPKRRRRVASCLCRGSTPPRPGNKFCDECISTGKALSNLAVRIEDLKSETGRKRFLLRTRKLECSACLRAEWQGKPIPLQADHIDGNSDNNTENNLRLICPNCHAQTSTFAGRNRGRGRSRQKSHNKRYAEGLKY
jgi:hypothetical protein